MFFPFFGGCLSVGWVYMLLLSVISLADLPVPAQACHVLSLHSMVPGLTWRTSGVLP